MKRVMTEAALRSKLTSLEEEIRILKNSVFKKKSTYTISKKRFSFLEGLWKGKTDFSLEQIAASEIKFRDDL